MYGTKVPNFIGLWSTSLELLKFIGSYPPNLEIKIKLKINIGCAPHPPLAAVAALILLWIELTKALTVRIGMLFHSSINVFLSCARVAGGFRRFLTLLSSFWTFVPYMYRFVIIVKYLTNFFKLEWNLGIKFTLHFFFLSVYIFAIPHLYLLNPTNSCKSTKFKENGNTSKENNYDMEIYVSPHSQGLLLKKRICIQGWQPLVCKNFLPLQYGSKTFQGIISP